MMVKYRNLKVHITKCKLNIDNKKIWNEYLSQHQMPH